MTKAIGVDIGYGYTKTYYREGSGEYPDVFPTAVSGYVPTKTFSDRTVIKVNGKPFIAGDDALLEGIGVLDTRRRDFVGSDAYYAILGYALYRAGVEPEVMILGLPPGQLSRHYTEELEERLKNADITINGYPLAGKTSMVRYIPQGAGIYFAVVEESGADCRKDIAVVDIGFHTVDMTLFVKGRYVENGARTYPFGISEVHELVRKRFYREHRLFLKGNDGIDRLLSSCMVELAGISYELDPEDIKRSYADRISSLIKSYLEELSGSVEVVILGGGGAKFLQGTTAYDTGYRLDVIEDPHIANAKGFFYYGRGALGGNE